MSGEWSLAALHDVIADAVGDRDMLVWEGTRRTYAEVADRSRGLAGYLVTASSASTGSVTELERWECGQAPVALVMNNRPEYLESMYGCYRARAVPFNVNHHYQPAEVAVAARHGRGRSGDLPALVRGARRRRGRGPTGRLVDVDDGSGVAPLAGQRDLRGRLGGGAGVPPADPGGDDLYLVCTGGTTGAPKGVLWRQADIFVAAMAGAEATHRRVAARPCADRPAEVWFPAPPLMHAAAQWTAFSGLHMGATIVMHDDSQRFDARAILEPRRTRAGQPHLDRRRRLRPAARRRAPPAAVRPVLAGPDRDRRSDDERSRHKQALFELIPHVMIVDGYGASETGRHGLRRDDPRRCRRAGLAPGAGACVLSADRSRFLARATTRSAGPPAEDGFRSGTSTTGRRPRPRSPSSTVSGLLFPATAPSSTTDGSIRMLGRDSMVVNTGGEKVFVEEVEQALLRHPAVVDALVVGRPSERFGQEVVAVVQLVSGADTTGEALREHCAASLARFKAPRAVFFVDAIDATRPASPTTSGPVPWPTTRWSWSPLSNDRCPLIMDVGDRCVRRPVGGASEGSGLGDVEVLVAQCEGLLGADLRPGS